MNAMIRFANSGLQVQDAADPALPVGQHRPLRGDAKGGAGGVLHHA